MQVQQDLSNFERLAQLRDEIRLKIHLGGADLRDQWSELELKWKSLETRLTPLRKAGLASVHEIGSAARLLLQELADGYERIRNALRDL